ncbi:hypothetical protein [Janthinobacterium aquaticum]|uniref:hypothetical protein n=1 Tax=Janthinobacterium sp. FT58W TaxID=2654254 RepID=UPI00186ACE68|nr:hypothetical protein [Janthinobacterium sp. FT58W]
MLTLKVLACLALSTLLLAPLVLRQAMAPSSLQTLEMPQVHAQAMWERWAQR